MIFFKCSFLMENIKGWHVLIFRFFFQDMLWWLQSIPLSPENHDACKVSFYGINAIGESEWAAEALLSEYDVMKYVETLCELYYLPCCCVTFNCTVVAFPNKS